MRLVYAVTSSKAFDAVQMKAKKVKSMLMTDTVASEKN